VSAYEVDGVGSKVAKVFFYHDAIQDLACVVGHKSFTYKILKGIGLNFLFLSHLGFEIDYLKMII
jgi:hypothetical protein